MAGYLNVDAIRSAADLLNSSLAAKGYITNDLLFPTVDWKILIKDQSETNLDALKIQPTLYNNDKNVINLLYSLTQALDRHTQQHRALISTIDKRDKTIAHLQLKVAQLEAHTRNVETKLSRADCDLAAVLDRTNLLVRQNKAQQQELTRLRNWNADLQAKYDVELRKKTLEISMLRDKLLDTRNLSTTLTYGKLGEVLHYGNNRDGRDGRDGRGTAGRTLNVNTNLIYGNMPVEQLEPQTHLSPDESLAAVVREEYDDIAAQLSELLERILRENGRFSTFCRCVNDYFHQLNSELALLAASSTAITTPLTTRVLSPADVIDLKKVTAVSVDEVEPFETVSAPLMARLHENFDCLAAMMAVGREPAPVNLQMDGDELNRLREENGDLKDNLKEALRALDGYKEYKHKRQE